MNVNIVTCIVKVSLHVCIIIQHMILKEVLACNCLGSYV